jgi:hypothetical protein
MTEDKFEEFLKKTAQDYNAPPARTPREDMWSAIEAQRAAGPRVVYGGGSAMRESPVRRFGSRIWLGAAAAALLFLVTGVGIGRWSASRSASNSVAAANTPRPDSSSTSSEGTLTTAAPGDAGSVATTQTGAGGSDASVRGAPDRNSAAPQTDSRAGNGTRVALGGSSANSNSSSAYQLTAVRHLSEAEALLTSFRTRSTTDQQMDAQLGSWARELLSNTRLLLDSPVANDPQRRPLLEDLELVLVQIVQLSPGSTPQDRELIERTLQQDHVMTRLRTAIPAGSQRGS